MLVLMSKLKSLFISYLDQSEDGEDKGPYTSSIACAVCAASAALWALNDAECCASYASHLCVYCSDLIDYRTQSKSAFIVK